MSGIEIVSMRLGVLEKAFIQYYAATYGKSQAEIVRTIVNKYVSSDKSFNADSFSRFVKKNVAPTLEEEEDQEHLLGVVKDYVGTRKERTK